MSPKLITKLGLSTFASSTLLMSAQPKIHCDSKRNFYEEKTTSAVPGLPTKSITEEQEPQLPKLVSEKKDDPTRILEDNIRVARLQLIEYLNLAKSKYIEQSDNYYKAERQVTDTLSSLHDKRELLFPNALYVLTGFMSGMVLSRRSNILVRATAPIACSVIAFKIFLPSTFSNSFKWLEKVEKKNLPDLHNKQTELINKTESLIKDTENMTKQTESTLNDYFNIAKRFIATTTGLNLDQEVSSKKK